MSNPAFGSQNPDERNSDLGTKGLSSNQGTHQSTDAPDSVTKGGTNDKNHDSDKRQ